ncbi:pyocin knob domain-containing protein [Paenibacillus pabuli]|uniref:pyocin knob domain-containing protein n=1 Tax=Paenibacillus pabuli TaxID=1472 RepID=UPI0034580492
MPQETDRLKLPLPLGNENVTRESINGIFEKIDAGVATQADLDTLREAVSKMDIPDASLTQKGKVQLSSKTDGTSEAMAATEKAVRDARVAAQDNVKSYVDAKTWQKFKFTADDGSSQRLSDGADLNFVTANGQYNGVNLGNAPTPQNVNEWWYIEVQRHSINTNYVLQRASRLNGTSYQPTLYQRIKLNGIWGAWSPDVFQSGVDAKNGIVGAINAKGGSASTSDPWATLATKIQGLSSPASVALSGSGSVSLAVGETKYFDLQTFPSGTKYALFATNATTAGTDTSSGFQTAIYAYSNYQSTVVLRDKNNTIASMEWISNGFTLVIKSVYIDFINRSMTYISDDVNASNKVYQMPANFDLSGTIRLSFRFERKADGFQVSPTYKVGGRLIYA